MGPGLSMLFPYQFLKLAHRVKQMEVLYHYGAGSGDAISHSSAPYARVSTGLPEMERTVIPSPTECVKLPTQPGEPLE